MCHIVRGNEKSEKNFLLQNDYKKSGGPFGTWEDLIDKF